MGVGGEFYIRTFRAAGKTYSDIIKIFGPTKDPFPGTSYIGIWESAFDVLNLRPVRNRYSENAGKGVVYGEIYSGPLTNALFLTLIND